MCSFFPWNHNHGLQVKAQKNVVQTMGHGNHPEQTHNCKSGQSLIASSDPLYLEEFSEFCRVWPGIQDSAELAFRLNEGNDINPLPRKGSSLHRTHPAKPKQEGSRVPVEFPGSVRTRLKSGRSSPSICLDRRASGEQLAGPAGTSPSWRPMWPRATCATRRATRSVGGIGRLARCPFR